MTKSKDTKHKKAMRIIPGGLPKFEDPCRRCKGAGRVTRNRGEGQTDICPRCFGDGRILPAPRV